MSFSNMAMLSAEVHGTGLLIQPSGKQPLKIVKERSLILRSNAVVKVVKPSIRVPNQP